MEIRFHFGRRRRSRCVCVCELGDTKNFVPSHTLFACAIINYSYVVLKKLPDEVLKSIARQVL